MLMWYSLTQWPNSFPLVEAYGTIRRTVKKQRESVDLTPTPSQPKYSMDVRGIQWNENDVAQPR